MKFILILLILLSAAGMCFGQTSEEIYEILEGQYESGEYELTTLIEEIQDSIFEIGLRKDSVKKNGTYRSPVRTILISTWWQNIEKAAGYMETDEGTSFMGPRYGMRERVQAGGRNFQIKAIVESDPGESDFRNPDHRSAGIAITPYREDFSIFFGDYHVEAGLGLGMASRPVFSSWKGEPHLLVRQKNRISLHGGSDENRFLRGAAAEVRLSKVTGKVFISGKNLDVSMKEREEGLEYFSGIYSTGLHRTENEIEKKDAVYEEVQGMILEYSGRRFELGGLLTLIKFSDDFILPIEDTWPRSDPEYENSGSRYSIWGRSLFAEGMIMGEYALSGNLASAFKISYSRFDKNGITYNISYRRNEKGFFSHGTMVSSSLHAKDSDSEGCVNLLYRPRRKWGVQTDIRIKGIENPGIEYTAPNLKIRSYIYYDFDNVKSEYNIQAESGKVRGSIRIKPKDLERALYWQGEIGISSNRISNLIKEPGTFISTRIRYRNPSKSFTFQTGLSLFTAKEGSIPFYTYEPDVLYGMSLPALTGSGARVFALLQYSISQSIRIELKLARTVYEDRDCIGSSFDRIPFGHRTGCKVQVVYRLN